MRDSAGAIEQVRMLRTTMRPVAQSVVLVVQSNLGRLCDQPGAVAYKTLLGLVLCRSPSFCTIRERGRLSLVQQQLCVVRERSLWLRVMQANNTRHLASVHQPYFSAYSMHACQHTACMLGGRCALTLYGALRTESANDTGAGGATIDAKGVMPVNVPVAAAGDNSDGKAPATDGAAQASDVDPSKADEIADDGHDEDAGSIERT